MKCCTFQGKRSVLIRSEVLTKPNVSGTVSELKVVPGEKHCWEESSCGTDNPTIRYQDCSHLQKLFYSLFCNQFIGIIDSVILVSCRLNIWDVLFISSSASVEISGIVLLEVFIQLCQLILCELAFYLSDGSGSWFALFYWILFSYFQRTLKYYGDSMMLCEISYSLLVFKLRDCFF